MPGFVRCILFLAFLSISPGVTYSQEMMPLRANPIDLTDDRAPAGKPFAFTITLPKETENQKISFAVYFTAGENKISTSAYVDKVESAGNQVVYAIKATVPKYEDIFKKVKRKWHEGWWAARRARVTIATSVGQDIYEDSFVFAIPLRMTATLWGIFSLVVLLASTALMKPNPFPPDTRFGGGAKDKRAEEWKKHYPSRFSRVLLYPLHFAVTPIGTYSISVAQILFWSAIVIFASVYVFIVRSEFLHVSAQVLTLLGISGGTALAAKANAVSRSRDIPAEFFQGLERRQIPRLLNLVSKGGVPSIFKFQIFAFTLINGILVLSQLYAHFDFPVIPNEQLTLMGISSAVYLGNEIAGENVWAALEKKVEEAKEASDRGDTAAYKGLKKEITESLKSIYDVT